MVPQMLVELSAHSATSIPAFAADQVDLFGKKGIGGSNHRTNVVVIDPIFDRYVKLVSPLIKVCTDCLDTPVAILIVDVASIALGKQRPVKVGFVRPGFGHRPDTNLALNRIHTRDPRLVGVSSTTPASKDLELLAELIKARAVVHERVILSSGQEADFYIDLRRVTLDVEVAPLIGRVMCDLVNDWQPEVAGGLTLGADPVVSSMLHASATSARPLNGVIVRKNAKDHGLQRQVEGPDIKGKRVVAVEDTSTTGGSVLTAVEAMQKAGGEVVGVAVIVDRGARNAVEVAGYPYRAALTLSDLGLA